MKYPILILSMLLLGIISCEKSDDDCTDTTLNTTSLEAEYGCIDTKYQMDVELSESHIIIRNQLDFTELVSGSCQPDIDFSVYDLVIGKQGLTSGNDTIYYKLIENCETGNEFLTITFIQDATTIAPTVTYHALIPKLEDGQEHSVEIVIN